MPFITISAKEDAHTTQEYCKLQRSHPFGHPRPQLLMGVVGATGALSAVLWGVNSTTAIVISFVVGVICSFAGEYIAKVGDVC